MQAFYLPQLVPNHQTDRGVAGSWVEGSKNLFNTLPRDFNVSEKDSRTEVINAIPTSFARAWLFSQALFADLPGQSTASAGTQDASGAPATPLKTHPLKQRVTEEWRGLLGIFCFHDLLDIKIEKRHYTLPDSKDANKSNQRFVSVLNALLPEPKDEWRYFDLIVVDDVILGCTSPRTIFYTPAEYDCPESIRWRKKEKDEKKYRLGDPTNYFTHSLERGYLRCWLEDILENAKKIRRDPPRGPLLAVLRQWLSELGTSSLSTTIKLGDPYIDKPPYSFFTKSIPKDAHVEVDKISVDGASSEKEGGDAGTQKTKAIVSSVLLKTTRQDVLPPLVFHEKLLTSQWRVHGATMGDMVKMPDGASGNSFFTKTRSEIKYPWIRPEVYFMSKYLLKLPLTENARGMIIDGNTYLYPLTESFFKYFSPKDISVKAQGVKGNAIEVTLTLPLSDERVAVTKTYTPDFIKDLTAIPPILEVWPNFIADGWKHYYFYSSTGGKRKEERLEYDFAPLTLEEDPKRRKEERDESCVWLTANYPDIVIGSYGGESVGVMILRKPSKLGFSSKKWTVGVDFGTSNTAVMYRVGDDTTQAMKVDFQDRCVPLISVELARRQVKLPIEFFASDVIHSDFPSLFVVDKADPSVEKDILGGVTYTNTTITAWNAIDNLKSELKWAVRERDQLLISVMLNHIVILVLAEAKAASANEVEFRWSYPTALNHSIRTRLDGFWNEMLGRLEIAKNMQAKKAYRLTESEALAQCLSTFGGVPIKTECPTVAIDIGGGTCDIAVWAEDNPLLQTSFKLAGNDTIPYFEKHVGGVLEKMAEWVGYSEPDKQVVLDVAVKHNNAVINAILRDNENRTTIRRRLREGKELDERMRQVRTLISIFFGGLSFFAGMLTKHAMKKIRGEKWEEEIEEKNVPAAFLFLGGKASRQMEWICDFDEYSKVLEAIFRSSFGDTPLDFELWRAGDLGGKSMPKEEVARGLVAADVTKPRAMPEPVIIVGEDGYTIGNKLLAWDDMITAPLSAGLQPGKIGFVWFEHFLDHLNKHHGRLGLDSVKQPIGFKSLVQDRIQDSIKAGKDVVVQPMFIFQLKTLMEGYVSSCRSKKKDD